MSGYSLYSCIKFYDLKVNPEKTAANLAAQINAVADLQIDGICPCARFALTGCVLRKTVNRGTG